MMTMKNTALAREKETPHTLTDKAPTSLHGVLQGGIATKDSNTQPPIDVCLRITP
jgi:hypothetical protein